MYTEITAAGSDILSIAIDLQGPEFPRPFHDKARAQFTTVVDAGTVVTRTFGVPPSTIHTSFSDPVGRIVSVPATIIDTSR